MLWSHSDLWCPRMMIILWSQGDMWRLCNCHIYLFQHSKSPWFNLVIQLMFHICKLSSFENKQLCKALQSKIYNLTDDVSHAVKYPKNIHTAVIYYKRKQIRINTLNYVQIVKSELNSNVIGFYSNRYCKTIVDFLWVFLFDDVHRCPKDFI